MIDEEKLENQNADHGEQKSERRNKRDKEERKKSNKSNRIVIRNLIIDISKKHLTKLLSPFGEIKEINIPMHPDKNISRGFAFVEFATLNQCHSAINKLNGTQFKGRTIVLDFSLAKEKFLEQKINQKDQEKEESVKGENDQKLENQSQKNDEDQKSEVEDEN